MRLKLSLPGNLLDEASETENDEDVNLCQAVCVGVWYKDEVRPLCSEACRDAAAAEPTMAQRRPRRRRQQRGLRCQQVQLRPAMQVSFARTPQ